MPDLRDMELLAALAKHRHFARAADESGISQPAFSARIRNLELDLGAPIVKRGNRFMGFTREGEIALRWAHQMIADARGLRQEIERARGVLSGSLTIGAVPTALAYVSDLTARVRKAHPNLTVQIFSHTSVEIARGLEEFSLDAGVTYLESARPATCLASHVYDERYELLAPPTLVPHETEEISWQAAAELPLCLLSRNMLNRKFIDTAFKTAGAEPNLVLETNAFTAVLAQVASGSAATIAPEMLSDKIPILGEIRRLRMVEPVVAKPIGIVVSDREPMLPAVEALMASVEQTVG